MSERSEVDEELLNEKMYLFDNEVQLAIKQVVQSIDPLDSPDFNPTDYINQLFPTEQSLSNIDEAIGKVQGEIKIIDNNIRRAIRDQSNSRYDGRDALEEAKKLIQQLFGQITEVQARAVKTEDIVKEITRDIKQLDSAKKNLTSAITTLNHLHMLVGGVESLIVLAENRQYGELLNPLQAITEVNQHFKQYNQVEQIKELSNKVDSIHQRLEKQINEDFHNVFAANPSGTKTSLSQLKDALLVVSVLDTEVKNSLLRWFIDLQLEEYKQLFHENQDIAWLDKIDRRYAWLKRHLLEFEAKYDKIFPSDWELSEHITTHFCRITRDELAKIMAKRRNEIDVKLLLYAINKTSNFEILLAKRFSCVTFGVKAMKKCEIDPEKNSPFVDLIGNCFKSYLDIYINSIDKNLAEILDRFVQDSKQPFDPIVNGSTVFPNCADLFVFFKKCMVQCSQLSNENPLYDLSIVFKKYLKEYAFKILQSRIPKMKTLHTSLGTSMSMLTKDLQNLSAAAGQVIHNLLKEDETVQYTKEEIILVCCILTTAEYCLETVQQLEEKLREKIHQQLMEQIDFGDEKDLFHRIISNCIYLLVQEMEIGCEPALTVMTKIQWQTIGNVGDQSPFVNSIISHFTRTIPIIRDNLSSSRKFYTQFCHKFVSSLIPKYVTNLYKCRLTSTSQDECTTNVLGCEQLLLDTHSIKTVLLGLPSIGSQINRKPPASYVKVVIKGMTKAEMIIKIVMAPIVPADMFIGQFLKLLPECTLAEFHKVLDMKCVRRVDQVNLVELFKRNAPEESSNTQQQKLSVGSSEERSLDMGHEFSVKNSDSDKGHIKKLEKLIKKRLPN